MDFRSEYHSSQREGCQKPEHTRLVSTQCVVCRMVMSNKRLKLALTSSGAVEKVNICFGLSLVVLCMGNNSKTSYYVQSEMSSLKCLSPKRPQAEMSYIRTNYTNE